MTKRSKPSQKSMNKNPSAEELKTVIWDTITKLNAGHVNIQHANAVSKSASVLVGVVRTELKIAEFVKVSGGRPKSLSKLRTF